MDFTPANLMRSISRRMFFIAAISLIPFLGQAAERPAPPPREHVAAEGQLIPPATPLVACDPYFSIWSQADKLTDRSTTHWTGKQQRLSSLARIDGKAYRIMGGTPEAVPALAQKSLEVLPTRTIYKFEDAGIALTVTFMTATLPYDLNILSKPVTYVIYDAASTDGKEHEVSIYFDAGGEVAVNTPNQTVAFKMEEISGLATLRIGSVDQQILAKRGDDIRID
jgi:hypothetical protein